MRKGGTTAGHMWFGSQEEGNQSWEWYLWEAALNSPAKNLQGFHFSELNKTTFRVRSVAYKGALRCHVKKQVLVAEVNCCSSQAQEVLRLDISAGKSKFCPVHTSFISDTNKNYLALFSLSLAISLCLFCSFNYNCLCSASGRVPWGTLLPTCVILPFCSFKVWSLEASWNTAKRAVACWIKQTLFKFPKLWCLGQTPCLLFHRSPSGPALKEMVLCQAST